MPALVIIAIAIAVSPFVLSIGFITCETCKRALDAKVELPKMIVYSAAALLPFAYAADLVFNLTWAALMFRQLARWRLVLKVIPLPEPFTWRLQRNIDTGCQLGRTLVWANAANYFAPGHIRV